MPVFAVNNPPALLLTSLTADTANAKQKLVGMPGQRVSTSEIRVATDLAPVSCTFNRRTGAAAFAAISAALAVTAPVTEMGVTFLQQLPVNGLGLNLAQDGAIATSFGRNVDAAATLITDAAAPSGFALKAIGTGYTTLDVIRAEAGRAYSLALSMKGDGTNAAQCLIEWLDASGAALSTLATLSTTGTSYADQANTNATAPASTKFIRFKARSAAATGIAYFSALRFKQQTAAVAAWGSTDQQFFPDSCAVFTAAAGNEQLAIPSTLAVGTFGVTITYEPTTSPHAANARLLEVRVDATNMIRLTHTTTDTLVLEKLRAGTVVSTATSAALGSAVGSQVTISITQDATGIYVDASVNGGAWVSANDTGEQAKLALAGTVATIQLGSLNNASNWADGKVGVARITGAMTSAQRQTTTPYRLPDNNDLAVWCWPGFGMQVPTFDDRLIALGTSYDYQALSTAAAATPTTATGPTSTSSVAAAADAWWVRSSSDATKDVKMPVLNEFPYATPRLSQVSDPVSGAQFRSVVLGQYMFGAEGRLKLKFVTVTDQTAKEKALRTIIGSTDTLYLQNPFGDLLQVRFPKGISGFSKHETVLDADLEFIQVG